jgi:DNA-binding PadR family transcriptional regulator
VVSSPLRMTRPRMAILHATTESTAEGQRIYNHAGEVWDRATGTVVSAVVNYLLHHGLLSARRLEERNGKTVVRYWPTGAGWEWLNKEKSNG